MKLLRALAALTLFTLAACGGARPITMAEIAVFPEATELPAGESAMTDAVAASVQSTVGGNLSSETRLYRLPEATTWEEVRGFYAASVEEGDWEPAAELDSANEALSTAGWQRGGLASKQVLLVSYVAPLPGEAPSLVVALYSEGER